MKLLSTIALFAILATTTAIDDRGCVESVAPGQDLFPVKVTPVKSKFWDVAYFETYKIVTNKSYNATYLLYQCGTEIPTAANDGSHVAVLEIPLTDVAIAATPFLSFMEQLGLRDEIAAFLSDPQYVASPCFAQAIESGAVSIVQEDDTGASSFNGLSPPDAERLTTFITNFQGPDPPPLANNAVVISEDLETTNDAIFEWVKYFSVFFNKEDVANKVFATAEHRYACVAENAKEIVADDGAEKPKILWAYYSEYCGGWDVGECPNYYCEYAEACSAEIMGSSEGTHEPSNEYCTAVYMTDEEFFEHGKDADFWFFPSNIWDKTEAMYNESMSEIKAYREGQVYDYMGRGDDAWFEQRFAEYYKVVEDLCHTIGVKESLTGRNFWRNVFTENIPQSGIDAECNNETAANILVDRDPECDESTSIPAEPAPNSDDPPSTATVPQGTPTASPKSATMPRALKWAGMLTAAALLHL